MKILAAEISFGDGVEYIATAAFATSSTDTPANQLFVARMSDSVFERSVSFAIWRGDRSVVPPVQELVLLNGDGALDAWLEREIKDRQVILRSGYIDQPYSTWSVRARLTGDRVSQAGRSKISIKFRSKLQLLQKQATATWGASTPNSEIRGSRQPVAIGKLNYAGGVLHEHVSNFERIYSVSDWPIHSITYWYSRYSLDVNPGYFLQGLPEAVHGFRRRTTTSNPGPDDRVCLEMRGAIRLGDELLGSVGEFVFWTADVPNGWTVVASAGTVSQSPTGCALIFGEDVFIKWSGLTFGQLYSIEVLTNAVYSGVWMIINGSTTLHYQPYDTMLAGPRVWRLTFTASAADISIGIPYSATGSVSIDRVRIWPATPVDRIQNWVEHLCVDRGGLDPEDVDSTSLAALEAAKGWDLAYANEQGSENAELLWKALDSLNSCLFEGANGQLKAAWLQDPSDMTSSGTITDDDFMESLEWDDDEMDGLSTSIIYSVNYAQLSANEIQTLQSAVTIPQATIESLRRADRKVTSDIAVASHYSRSADNAPMPTLLIDASAAEAEADDRCTLASVRRKFGRCALRDRASFAAMEPGQAWTLSSTRWGEFPVYITMVRGTLLSSEPVLRIRLWR
jgi:hypothetical protein